MSYHDLYLVGKTLTWQELEDKAKAAGVPDGTLEGVTLINCTVVECPTDQPVMGGTGQNTFCGKKLDHTFIMGCTFVGKGTEAPKYDP